MSTARQINYDYRDNLFMMLAESMTWGHKSEVCAWIGSDEYPLYIFEDGSCIEFRINHGFVMAALVKKL